MADKCRPVCRNRWLFNSNTGPSYTKRNYKKYILKQPNIDEMCRRCGKEPETVQHITAACEQLAPTECIRRHDGVAKVIHQKLAEAVELTEHKCPHYR
jgi:ribosomal protein L37E